MLDATGRTITLQGPRRLLLAVLQEAIGTFQRCLTARDRRGRVAFKEVREWFASEETEWVFSFVSVCDALAMDPTYVRASLRRWVNRQRAPFEAALPRDVLSFRESGRQAGRGLMTGHRAGRRAGARTARGIPPVPWY